MAAMADYAATRDDLSLPLFEVTDAIAALDWDLDQIKATASDAEPGDEARSRASPDAWEDWRMQTMSEEEVV